MSDATDSERAALEALGYTEEWLHAGILERRLLAEQHERFQSGGTRKTGRYRAETLEAWRGADGPLEDAQIDAFLSVMAADPDPKLAQSAIAALIATPRISLEQLQRIALSDKKLMRRHEPLIRRTYLTRRLDEGVTDELLAQVIDGQDAGVQTSLLRDPRLSRKQAELLAKRGANPTIREKAQVWYQDKKFWK